MKILFLTDGIHPFVIGGMQKHSLILSRLLAQKGNDVHIVHCGGEGYDKESFHSLFEKESEHIQETYIPFPKTDPFPGHYIRENKKYSELILKQLTPLLPSFDIIYTQGFTAWAFLKNRDQLDIKAPILSNFHGFEMFQTAPSLKVKAEHLLLRKTVKTILKRTNYVYSFGGKIDAVLAKLGIPQTKILHHSNGIKEDWLIHDLRDKTINNECTFTFIGRNERRKGIEELNEALVDLLADQSLSFTFNFIGPIPASSQIKDKQIAYFGEIRDAERIKELIDSSDCLVCPSHSEGMPTVILEAMARGLAVIATDVGAVSRMIDRNGILIDQADPTLLTDAIKKIIHLSEEDLEAMKRQSLKLVKENFTWEVIADQKIQDFKRILKEKNL